ncbi:hypothetical protein [Acanthopleuribacter pedis]|uniref:SWIM-type domain-containing protein n=1 Tax=Acanthopleuribacter pedis TaxID=442870 RepID=A0A8J7Q5V8_9BACT|nr:hypothetical protein [Acanthopleuribacter pedis]MBO1317209.1 hypothetical protein [Acanthopleuribacter pedis]MBO1318515.1 hypothetical protein [Acanthopleuribacter pedis]
MEFNYRYSGSTEARSNGNRTDMSFAPDTLREPTYFGGELAQAVPFREAISALHAVVVSDLRFKPRDTTAYKAWREARDMEDLAELTAGKQDLAKQMEAVGRRLAEARRAKAAALAPFYKARNRYFDYLYKKDYDKWFVLDPVITVHPDELFFECFSQDEATYGRLSCDYGVFKNINDFACGTTNIDYSANLYREFQKIRTYKTTRFDIDPGGFEVTTGLDEGFKEVKIDLPDSWVRGFLQVSSAMTLPMVRLHLTPMDIHNLCFVLRRKREKQGPRSIRFQLKPGEPIRALIEPWNDTLVFARSEFRGREETEIRLWGRRRLLILERLIPIARGFTFCLAGTGMPSFMVADLGGMSFTLGMSGWTSNDWSRAGNFDLMAPRAEVDQDTKLRVFKALRKDWQNTADAVAKSEGLARETVLGALSAYTQAGSVMFDLAKDVFRARELSREPLPMDKLRFANPREAEARALVDGGGVTLHEKRLDPDGNLHLSATVKEGKRTYQTQLRINSDQALKEGSCQCNFFTQNKLYRGPCVHLLATRLRFSLEQGGIS